MNRDNGAPPSGDRAFVPSASIPSAGDVFHVVFPFVLRRHDTHEQDPITGYWDKVVPVPSWSPGVDFECGDEYGPPVSYAHAEGEMVLTVVAVAPIPKPYQSRVFYTRHWVDPLGKPFGKTGLRVETIEKFRRISSRYAHPYDLDPNAEAEKLLAQGIVPAKPMEREAVQPEGVEPGPVRDAPKPARKDPS